MGVRETKGRSGEDPGKIHRSWGFGEDGEIQGRSIDPEGSVFRGVGGSIGKGTRREGVGAESKVTRMRARGGGVRRRGRG